MDDAQRGKTIWRINRDREWTPDVFSHGGTWPLWFGFYFHKFWL